MAEQKTITRYDGGNANISAERGIRGTGLTVRAGPNTISFTSNRWTTLRVLGKESCLYCMVQVGIRWTSRTLERKIKWFINGKTNCQQLP